MPDTNHEMNAALMNRLEIDLPAALYRSFVWKVERTEQTPDAVLTRLVKLYVQGLDPNDVVLLKVTGFGPGRKNPR